MSTTAATETYAIRGMHCTSCSTVIERTLAKAPGVVSVSVQYATERARITYEPALTSPHILSTRLEPLGYTLTLANARSEEYGDHRVERSLGTLEQQKELRSMRTQLLVALPIALVAAMMMAWDILTEYELVPMMGEVTSTLLHHLVPLLATYMLFVAGKPYLLGLYRFLRYRTANMDTLIGLGTTAAYLYSFAVTAFEDVLRPYIQVEYQYYDVTIVVIAFITLGKYLEARSKLKTGDAIEALLNLQAKTALIVHDGREVEVPIGDVVVGDTLVVKSGTKLPVDGLITEGASYLNESMVTGEPMPVEKKQGDSVVAGTLNTTGSFSYRATKVGAETLLAQIIRMVEEAQGSKAPIQALADRISARFVPAVLIVAFLALGVWLTVGAQYLGVAQALSYGLVSFVGVLVIACPCALGLATPTAIIVGVGKGARDGILIKDAATLEKLHRVDTVVFDKTGTLTKGAPAVTDLVNLSAESDDELLSVLAALEKKSEHPLARAIVEYAAAHGVPEKSVSHFESITGKGLTGTIGEEVYVVGNAALMRARGMLFDEERTKAYAAAGKTPVFVGTNTRVLGFVMMADEVKPESREALKKLHALGVRSVMLTGDDVETARYIAAAVGIDEVVAQVLPADKLAKIRSLQSEGRVVAMAGDGVNDAPALAAADVGIAMGTGTDVAIESAGITLLTGDLSKLVKAFTLSKMTMRGIKQNLFFAFVYNVVGIPLAAGMLYPVFGWVLNPIFAGCAMALSSVSVVSNSLRIKAKRL